MSEKYMGVDAHQAGLVIEVMGAKGNCLMHSVIPTRADAIKEFFGALKGIERGGCLFLDIPFHRTRRCSRRITLAEGYRSMGRGKGTIQGARKRAPG